MWVCTAESMYLGCFASGSGTAHFHAVKLLCSKAGWPHPNCLLGAVPDLCQLTGRTWELFCRKMVILDQYLCQGLWHQAPRFQYLLKAFPGSAISCYCRQNSDSSAVKCKCCFCSEFFLSPISRLSTT